MEIKALMDQSADLWNKYIDLVNLINKEGSGLQRRNVKEHTESIRLAMNMFQTNISTMEMERAHPEFFGVGIVYRAEEFEYIPGINKSGPFRYLPTGQHYTGQDLMEKLGMSRVEADRVISMGIQMPEIRTDEAQPTPGVTQEQYKKLTQAGRYEQWQSLVSGNAMMSIPGMTNRKLWRVMTPEERQLWIDDICKTH